MKLSRRALVAVVLLAFTPAAAAQNQLWIRQLGTSAPDRAYSAAPDSLGGVYMTGSTEGSLGGPHASYQDVWLSRYDGAGNQLWIRQLATSESETAYAAASDGSGGVYVGGSVNVFHPTNSHDDAWLARYDGAGNQLWIRQLGTTGHERILAAAPDGSGGVFVGGSTEGSLGGANAGGVDAWLARYDGLGNRAWIRQLGTPHTDVAGSAATDGSGGVFVSGLTTGSLGGQNPGRGDAWLARYDGAGNQAWIRQFGTDQSESVLGSAPDGSGGVFVGGPTDGSLGGPNANGLDDAWLARYDGAGNQAWIRQFGTDQSEDISAAAPDGSGGVFVTGNTNGNLGGPNAGSWDTWLARYDGAGNQAWISQLGTSASDRGRAAAPDASGGVYVGGESWGSLGGPFAGQGDAWFARYDGLATIRYCSPAIPNSTGQPAALNATGSNTVLANDLILIVSQLPVGQFGYFLAGQTQGLFMPPGSQGIICLTGIIGRYNQIGNLIQGPTDTFQIDLMAIPVNPPQAVIPGDTWNFQCVYRDNNPGQTSNFTDAISVTFM